MKNTNYLLLGAFVIVGTVLMTAGIILFASARLGREAVAMETYFTESVTGLDVGSPVRFRGVKIGEVRRIAEVAEKYETGLAYVLVEVGITSGRFAGKSADVINRDLADWIDRGLRTYLATQGITGIAYIETDIFDAARTPPLPIDWQPAVPYVPSAPSRIKNLGDSLDEVLTKLRQTDIPGLVEQGKAALRELREAVRALEVPALAAGSKETLAAINTFVDQTGASTRGVLDRADQLIARLQATVDTENLDTALHNFSRVSEEAVEAVADLRQVLGKADGLVHEGRELLRGPRREVDEVLANLRQVSRSLANLTGVLERYPSLLLFGEKPSPARLNK